jgi:hypothetical protein
MRGAPGGLAGGLGASRPSKFAGRQKISACRFRSTKGVKAQTIIGCRTTHRRRTILAGVHENDTNGPFTYTRIRQKLDVAMSNVAAGGCAQGLLCGFDRGRCGARFTRGELRAEAAMLLRVFGSDRAVCELCRLHAAFHAAPWQPFAEGAMPSGTPTDWMRPLLTK